MRADLTLYYPNLVDEVESLTAARAGSSSGTEPSDAMRVNDACPRSSRLCFSDVSSFLGRQCPSHATRQAQEPKECPDHDNVEHLASHRFVHIPLTPSPPPLTSPPPSLYIQTRPSSIAQISSNTSVSRRSKPSTGSSPAASASSCEVGSSRRR